MTIICGNCGKGIEICECSGHEEKVYPGGPLHPDDNFAGIPYKDQPSTLTESNEVKP